jgi:predicted nucleic acid binding AN1-type Zn finger protein
MQRNKVKASDPMQAKLSQPHHVSETESPLSISKQSSPLNVQVEEQDHKTSEKETVSGLKVCKACGKTSERMLKCPICKFQFKLNWYEFRPFSIFTTQQISSSSRILVLRKQ